MPEPLTCPTCGNPVRVEGSDEGTNHYVSTAGEHLAAVEARYEAKLANANAVSLREEQRAKVAGEKLAKVEAEADDLAHEAAREAARADRAEGK